MHIHTKTCHTQTHSNTLLIYLHKLGYSFDLYIIKDLLWCCVFVFWLLACFYSQQSSVKLISVQPKYYGLKSTLPSSLPLSSLNDYQCAYIFLKILIWYLIKNVYCCCYYDIVNHTEVLKNIFCNIYPLQNKWNV